MNREEFIKEVSSLGIELTQNMIQSLEIYCDYLLEVNEHTNLTAIKDREQIFLKHFYDSLTIIKAIDLKKINNLLDVGTGAGFPGMVLKIFYPNLNVTLLDSNNKKIRFLKELSEKLELKNINFFHGRVEEFCEENREKFDLVTARAVSNMTMLTELCMPLVKIEGYFIPLKGSNEQEVEESLYAIKILGGELEKNIKFKLPYEDSGRQIIKIKKIFNTSNEYPRRYEKILKTPLKKIVKYCIIY